MSVRIAVVGSRKYNNYKQLCRVLDHTFKGKSVTIVSGGAAGADTLAERYARERGYEFEVFKANWRKYGKSAGFKRNVEMLKTCHGIVAFWDGISGGTKHSLEVATRFKLPGKVWKFTSLFN